MPLRLLSREQVPERTGSATNPVTFGLGDHQSVCYNRKRITKFATPKPTVEVATENYNGPSPSSDS
jgi:hypothetical protein